MRTLLSAALVLGAVSNVIAEECPRECSKAIPNLNETVREFNRLIDQRRYAEADALAQDSVKRAPLDPVGQLMLRYSDLQSGKPQATGRLAEPERYITKTYSVADLVVPLPKLGQQDGATLPQFDLLIDLITSEIAADTWSDAGGGGSIQPHQTTLSLVVRQTEAVHEQIAEALDDLRSLQEVQVSLEMRLMSVPGAFVERMLDVKNSDADFRFEPLVFDAQEARQLLQALQTDRRTKVVCAPKVMVVNGQAAFISIDGVNEAGAVQPSFATLVYATVSPDRRSLELKLAIGKSDAQSILESATIIQMKDTQSVLLDVTEALDAYRNPELGSLPWTNAPAVRKLLARQAKDSRRELLLVTPRILVQEEEEELLGIKLPFRHHPHGTMMRTTVDEVGRIGVDFDFNIQSAP